MKRYILFILFILAGCSYSEGCFYTPQMVICEDKGKEYPYIAHFQKKETLGNTNPIKRIIDFKNCGGEKKENGDFDIKNNRDHRGVIIGDVVAKFKKCMFSKGYYIEYDCGYNNPKWSTGKCNID
ncbi:hypothetical protein A4G19_03040 [Pasteurellaceae bacterium Macca]|nr:hypothetical protein [Pasteurellaceae bacterium Macca]